MTTADFDHIISSNHLILAVFYAEWSGACRAIEPSLERISLSMNDRVDILRLDTQLLDHIELVRRYNIVSVPTFMLFTHSKKLWRDSGVIHYDRLCSIIHRHFFIEVY